ncbi:hypothetical protein C2W62_02910 [Candidatus Entotheonella serta]|nr:hypothetical protein C2W62_02910 [Candidatus Entotheonella serta]
MVVTGGDFGILIRVEPQNGDRTRVSSSPVFARPMSIVVAADGTLMEAAYFLGAVVQIDPVTGDRTIISGCTLRDADLVCIGELIGEGPPFSTPTSLVEVEGRLLVLDIVHDAVIEVDVTTGNRTIVSGCTSVQQITCTDELIGAGAPFTKPTDMTVHPNSRLIVTDTFPSAVIEVDPLSGDRTIISGGQVDRGNGPRFRSGDDGPRAVAVESDGNLVVVDRSRVIRFDPGTGHRSVVTGCTEFESARCIGDFIGTGPRFASPQGLTVEADGSLIVVDSRLEAVFRVDPNGGNRTIVSK